MVQAGGTNVLGRCGQVTVSTLHTMILWGLLYRQTPPPKSCACFHCHLGGPVESLHTTSNPLLPLIYLPLWLLLPHMPINSPNDVFCYIPAPAIVYGSHTITDIPNRQHSGWTWLTFANSYEAAALTTSLLLYLKILAISICAKSIHL